MRSKKPKPGDKVILVGLPPHFLNDLPAEDQRAISGIIGSPIRLNAYDEYGRAELEFKEKNGTIHFIYVERRFLKAAK
ncbi:MAG TPA: hypothetical protein VGR36_02110 [Candidatus Acidoferrales bacterium]|nr:hypothetical protein [Candidatus Acidoferrales bacterium]